jgi:N-formylmaleamate deformylase
MMKKVLFLIMLLVIISALLGSQTWNCGSFTMEVAGKGRPVALLPGLGCPGEIWRETVSHLSPHFTCYTVSIAGFAGAPGTEGFTPAEVERELPDFLKARGVNRGFLIGHSYGGFLALKMALARCQSEMIRADLRPELAAAIKIPTLVLASWAITPVMGLSREAMEKNLRQQYRNLEKCRVVFAENARHFVMLDDPACF